MLESKTESIESQQPVALVCDACGIRVEINDLDLEFQEFLRINFQGGYGSVFGEDAKVECHLCQKCVQVHLGNFLRIDD